MASVAMADMAHSLLKQPRAATTMAGDCVGGRRCAMQLLAHHSQAPARLRGACAGLLCRRGRQRGRRRRDASRVRRRMERDQLPTARRARSPPSSCRRPPPNGRSGPTIARTWTATITADDAEDDAKMEAELHMAWHFRARARRERCSRRRRCRSRRGELSWRHVDRLPAPQEDNVFCTRCRGGNRLLRAPPAPPKFVVVRLLWLVAHLRLDAPRARRLGASRMTDRCRRRRSTQLDEKPSRRRRSWAV